jgi:hypothetical protein
MGLQPGESAVITNGRLMRITPPQSADASDAAAQQGDEGAAVTVSAGHGLLDSRAWRCMTRYTMIMTPWCCLWVACLDTCPTSQTQCAGYSSVPHPQSLVAEDFSLLYLIASKYQPGAELARVVTQAHKRGDLHGVAKPLTAIGKVKYVRLYQSAFACVSQQLDGPVALRLLAVEAVWLLPAIIFGYAIT